MFFLITPATCRRIKEMGGKTNFVSVRVPPILRRQIDVMCETYRLDKATIIQDVLEGLVDYVATERAYRWPLKIVHDLEAAKRVAQDQEEMRKILQMKDPNARLRRLLGMDYAQEDRPDHTLNETAEELLREVKRREVIYPEALPPGPTVIEDTLRAVQSKKRGTTPRRAH